jgi:hypothetical protein
MRHFCTLVALAALAGASARAESPLSALLAKIRSAVEPDRAMAHMRAIHATDRWFTFPKFQETVEYLERSMRAAGLEETAVLGAPADRWPGTFEEGGSKSSVLP